MSKRPSSLLCCSLSSGISLRLTFSRPVRQPSILVGHGSAVVGKAHQGETKGDSEGTEEGEDDGFRISSSKYAWAPGRSLSDFRATAASPSVASFLMVAFC